MLNGQADAGSSDWPGRYHHIDQILETPGPRTDPSFAAGDEVRASPSPVIYALMTFVLSGQKVLARKCKDPSDWCRWTGL
jgi:hypothetical protein